MSSLIDVRGLFLQSMTSCFAHAECLREFACSHDLRKPTDPSGPVASVPATPTDWRPPKPRAPSERPCADGNDHPAESFVAAVVGVGVEVGGSVRRPAERLGARTLSPAAIDEIKSSLRRIATATDYKKRSARC